ncbi:VWA domain-containing protein [Kaistella flava (ex Peng et al. 2021)]|uniref:VWA domain-containing protein n=1 Tax=Kaistella flava (ex Peng et al. 2021) TaxID=2038776 RepID=A0A7M2Y8Y9_9FLAO|nr:VWA domain-containing protein [Kaistella flava (ex Peng et al. 2021)]QOW09803.1 VWA domain-containing protein [Kaistella flava (ex Peng et al. 2021)]
MLDITKSMWGLAGKPFDVFDKVKEELYKGIGDIKDPNTIVTIIPFQATYTYDILHSWTFKAGDQAAFGNMKKVIDSYTIKSVPGGYTDIYSALEKAKKQIDPDRTNYLFLLTDGEQSAVPSSQNRNYQVAFDNNALLKSLGNWCQFSQGKDVHLFYTMLTAAAVDQKIINIIKSQCNAYVTQGTNINIAFVQPAMNRLKINLHDNPDQIEIPFDANNWAYIKKGTVINASLSDNTLFELSGNSAELKNNKIILKLKRKGGVSFANLIKNNPINNILELKLSSPTEVIILKPIIQLQVSNKKERVLNLNFSKND